MKLGTEFTIKILKGLEFKPSAEMRKVPGVTWAGGEDHMWFVVFVEDEPVACCGLFKKGDSVRYKTDVVIPKHRGAGLYKMLFETRHRFAIDCNVSEATTYSNKESRHMYERAGFVAAGQESERGVLYMKYQFDKPAKSW